MRFVILGRTQLRVGERSVDLGPAKQRGMLALLLYHAGRTVETGALVDELWVGKSHEVVRNSMYQLVSRTRAVLRSAEVPGKLISATDGYRLDIDPDLVDYHLFGRKVRQAERLAGGGHHTTAASLLAEAIDLWEDRPLADLRGEWSSHRRDHLTQTIWLGAHKSLFDSLLAVGEHHTVLAKLGPLLDEHDLDETLARQWIIALDRCGRYADASAFYLDFRRRWLTELGSEPSSEVHDAYRQVLEKRQPLSSNPPRAPAAPATDEFVPPRQLPRDISDFTGRDRLLARLDTLLVNDDGQGGGVLVIDGMPGVGKTTLATHWAHRRRHLFPDGQMFLDINGYGPGPPVSPGDLLGRLLSALGVPADRIPANEDRRRSRLSHLLEGRKLLILVDSVSEPRQVRPLLPATTGCTVLITSRNRLKSLAIRDGARTVTVPQLDGEDSASLLRLAVGDKRAHEEPEALKNIAELSGGLPLALRIIGQHVAERPLAKLADLVHQLRRQLLAPETDMDDEDATVRTAFACSYQALPSGANRLFRLLSQHPGTTISVGAAASLGGVKTRQAEQLLDLLARAHLLQHDAAGRYRFHDLLRCFADDCARRQESPQRRRVAVRRMLDWYLLSATNAVRRLAPQRPTVPDLPRAAAIEPATFDSDAAAIRWCEQERENLTAATRCAAEHGLHNHAWQIPGAVHEIYERYGCQDDVLESNQIALASAKATGHRVGILGSLNNLGIAYHGFRDYERAVAHYEEGLRLARALHHRDGESAILHNLGNVHVKRREFLKAITLYEQARDIDRESEDAAGEAHSLHRLGKAYRHMGRHADALRHHHQALAIRERIGHLRGQGATHAELAALNLDLGEHLAALEHAQLALGISTQTKDQPMACDALLIRAGVRLATRRLPQAVEDASRAVDICRETADSGRRVRALEILAEAHAASGNHEPARRTWSEALTLLHDTSGARASKIRTRIAALPDAGTTPSQSS